MDGQIKFLPKGMARMVVTDDQYEEDMTLFVKPEFRSRLDQFLEQCEQEQLACVSTTHVTPNQSQSE